MGTIVGLTAEATEELTDAARARSNHTGTQAASTIIDLAEVSQDLMASTLVAGTNVTIAYNDGAGTITVSASGGGGGTTEGLLLSTYTNGLGTAAANTTALQTAINAAFTAHKPLINDLGAVDFEISDRINIVGDDFVGRFNGLRLVQTTANKAGVRFGGPTQSIDSLKLYAQASPTSADTASNGVEFANCLFSSYTNITVQNFARGFYMIQSAPSSGDPASNTVFSCKFDNIRINGWRISAIDFKTWPSGGGSSTGNAWDNVYCHNNWFASADACTESAVQFKDCDESSFQQFNVEWVKPTGDTIFMHTCRNMYFSSLHFEGNELTGNAALFRAYYNMRLTIDAFSAMTTTIANNSGQKSVFRSYSSGGNPVSIDVTSIRVRGTVNAGAKPFSLMEVESGTTGGEFEFRHTDTADFNGPVIVDGSGVSPSQVIGYNQVRLAPYSGLNIPVDLVRTADATSIVSSTTLVTDSTLQFAAAVGRYLIEGVLIYIADEQADVKYRYNFSGTATGKFVSPSINTVATVTPAQITNHAANLINTNYVAGGVDAIEVAMAFQGILNVTAAGTFSIQYAQNTSNSQALVIKALSYMSYRRTS
jgi:hypothetical protein